MIVYFAIILTVLLGFCGLAIDTGRMELRQDQLQAAADAGALAAAGELWHSGSGSNWQTAANNDIAAYEAANGIPSTGASTVQLGATYGPYVGDYSVVQATVTQSFPTVFLGLLTRANSSITLTAKAVAQMPPCMVFSGNPNYSGTYALWVTSSGIDVQQSWACPLYTRTGTVVDYFSHFYGSQTRSSAPASSSSYGGTWNPPVYNVPIISDPLAYVTPPPVGSCMATVSKLNQTAPLSYTPGTYCGKTNASVVNYYTPGPANCGEQAVPTTPAMDIEGPYTAAVGGVGCPSQGGGGNLNYANGGNCTGTPPTITFAPGAYVFIGGVNFTCATLVGNGVTFYFTKNGSVGFGQMRMTSTTWKVNAPTDNSLPGTIAGVSIMNDRAWTGSTDDFQWWYSSWYADGDVYLTGTGIFDFNMPMYAPNYLNIVAPNMYNYLGSIKPAVNYATLSAGNPLRTVVTLVQ